MSLHENGVYSETRIDKTQYQPDYNMVKHSPYYKELCVNIACRKQDSESNISVLAFDSRNPMSPNKDDEVHNDVTPITALAHQKSSESSLDRQEDIEEEMCLKSNATSSQKLPSTKYTELKMKQVRQNTPRIPRGPRSSTYAGLVLDDSVSSIELNTCNSAKKPMKWPMMDLKTTTRAEHTDMPSEADDLCGTELAQLLLKLERLIQAWQKSDVMCSNSETAFVDNEVMPPSPIMILSNDWDSIGALLCAVILICERVREDDCVDVFKIVKMLRTADLEAATTLSEYRLLHTCLEMYLHECAQGSFCTGCSSLDTSLENTDTRSIFSHDLQDIATYSGDVIDESSSSTETVRLPERPIQQSHTCRQRERRRRPRSLSRTRTVPRNKVKVTWQSSTQSRDCPVGHLLLRDATSRGTSNPQITTHVNNDGVNLDQSVAEKEAKTYYRAGGKEVKSIPFTINNESDENNDDRDDNDLSERTTDDELMAGDVSVMCINQMLGKYTNNKL